MLPLSLLLFIFAQTSFAQQSTLHLDSVSSFNATSIPNPPLFTIPTGDNLTISIALCSANATSSPRFFVTNSSSVADPGSSGGTDVFEIVLNEGQGNWTGVFPTGGVLAVEDANKTTFQIGVSDGEPLHEILDQLPLLGDTTANQALIFSPPFNPTPLSQPSYPNYTLPLANVSAPSPPTTFPNFTLVIAPTGSSNTSLTTIHQTGCLLGAQKSSGKIVSESLWLRDEEGWRTQWIIGALNPLTNYTAYVIQDKTKVSGPIFFVTKSPTFSCPLVSSLPYCPNIAYAIPLPAPSFPSTTYNSHNLPASISQPLLSSLTNFTTSLLTFACGRDNYSPLMTCADCQAQYRKWLCTVSFTRCGEAIHSPSSSSASSSSSSSSLAFLASLRSHTSSRPSPTPALLSQPTSTTPRNPNFPNMISTYTALLPCLEACTALDRACPNFLGIACPVPRFNAAASYGVGFVDSENNAGDGLTGQAQDRWGNIWCNSG